MLPYALITLGSPRLLSMQANKLKYLFLRVIRIEPIISTWKVEVIPFNYTRLRKLDFTAITSALLVLLL
jgi:hypothetical protein